MERHRVLGFLHIDAKRVVVARYVQRPDVQHHNAYDHERQKIVQAEEAVERRIADAEPAPQPRHDPRSQTRNQLIERTEEIGNHRRRPERHLSPRQHVAQERRRDHQHEDKHAENPEDLARRLVGAVIKSAEDVQVDGDEEHRGAVGMQVAQQPTVVHVAHDVFDAVEGQVRIGHVMHRQHDAGNDLDGETEGKNAAETVPDVQIPRRRKRRHGVVGETQNRQARIEPARELRPRRVGRRPGHRGS